MPEVAPPDQIHRYTVEEYEALEGHPSFKDRRVELIDGFIVDMNPRSPAHENVVRWLMRWLQPRLDQRRYVLSVAAPLRIANSEPTPQGYRDIKAYLADAAVAQESLAIEPMPFSELFAAA